MFVLALVPFIFGYLLAVRVLRERTIWMSVVLSYALGLFFYLFFVNIFFHFVPLRSAVYLTMGLLAAVSVGLGFIKARPAPLAFGMPPHAIWLAFFCATAFLLPLLSQMRSSDDDFFIHAPLMALYLKNNFPPRNPFFPDLPYSGHYGRDLTITSLSLLFGQKFLLVQYVLTALNQAAIALLGYLTAKRFLRSSVQAIFAMLLVFMAVNGGRAGLLEVFQNNNSFVYLLFFLDVYLYFTALLRRDVAPVIIAGLMFAVYGIVYETHYAILLMSVSLLPLIMALLRRRWRWRYVTTTAAIASISIVIALFQGGTLTDVAKRYLFKASERVMASEDLRGASQEITIGFPKRNFRITSWRGDTYPIFSRELIAEAGTSFIFFPLALALMIWRKNYFAIMFGLIAVFTVLVPAAVDFGRFNTESLRFLFFGGLCAAMLLGIAGVMTYGAVAERQWVNPGWLKIATASILIALFVPTAQKAVHVFNDAVKHPDNFFWNPEQWASAATITDTGSRWDRLAPVDIQATRKLRSLTRQGDVMLTNLYDPVDVIALRKVALLSALSGSYVTGMGVRFSKDLSYSMGSNFVKQAGYRAIAFWNTLDPDLLRDMKVNYLYVFPDNLPPAVYRKLSKEPGLQLIGSASDSSGLDKREIYKVADGPAPKAGAVPRNLRFYSADLPSTLRSERFYRIPVVFTGADGDHEAKTRLFYRLVYQGRTVNQNDEIKQNMTLKKLDGKRYAGVLYFCAPYEEGDYDVELYALDGKEYRPIPDEREQNVLFRVRIS